MRSLCLLSLAALSLSWGCTTAPSLVPTPEPARPDWGPMLAQIPPNQPVIVALRLPKLRPLLHETQELLGQELPLLGELGWLTALGDEGGAGQGWPSMRGLDPERPVILGLFGSDGAERPAVLGEDGPSHAWIRILLPARDPAALREALPAWGAAMGLSPGAEGRWEGAGKMAQARELDGKILQIDLLSQVSVPEAGARFLAEVGQRPAWARPTSPAWRALQESDGALDLYVDMERFAGASLGLDLLELQAYERQASAEQRASLRSHGWSALLDAALPMHALDRRVYDATWTLTSAPQGLPELRLTRSLHRAAQEDAAASQQRRAPVYAAAQPKPMLLLQVRQDLRTWIERVAKPTWTKDIPAEGVWPILQQGGEALWLYHPAQEPLALLGAWLEDKGVVPESLTVVVQDADFVPSGSLAVTAALVAEYPRAGLPPALQQGLDALVREVLSLDTGGAVQIQTEDSPHGTRLKLGLRRKAEELLRLDAPLPDAKEDVALSISTERLQKVVGVISPNMAPLLGRLGGAAMLDWTQGACHSTAIRLWRPQESEPPKVAIFEPAWAIAARTDSPGPRCMVALEAHLARALEALPSVAGPQRARLMDAITEVALEELACAEQDPLTRVEARRARASFLMWSARQLEAWGMDQEALWRAQGSCGLGHEPGCALSKALRAPWPADALRLPKLAWPQDATIPAHTTRLHVTQEGLYLGTARLADLTALDAPGDAPMAWLEQLPALSTGRHGRAAALIRADRALAWPRLRRLLRALEAAGYVPYLQIESLGGDARALALTSPPAAGAAQPEPLDFQAPKALDDPKFDPKLAAWLTLGGGKARLRAQGKDLGAWSGPADHDKTRLGLTHAAQKLGQRLGQLPTYYIEPGDDVTLEQIAALLPALAAPYSPSACRPPEAALDGPFPTWEALLQTVEHAQGWAFECTPTLVLGAQPPSASKTPQIKEGQVIVGPALSREQIGAVIRGGQPKFRACYEQYLREQTHREVARVSIEFSIGAEGSVVGFQAKNARPEHAGLVACLDKSFRALQFPKPAGGGIVIITYPFVFSPE